MLASHTLYRGILIALSCVLATPVLAQRVNVSGAWVRGTATGQSATGAFMELTASENAVLIGVSSPVAAVAELHEMSMDNGIMKMRSLPRLDLPAGKTVVLKPGSYHLMLMDLKQPLKKGEMVPLTLKIEGKDKKLSMVEAKAEVRDLTAPSVPGAPKAPSAADHSHHKH